MPSRRFRPLIALVLLAIPTAAQTGTAAPVETPCIIPQLSGDAQQIATVLGLVSQVERLRALRCQQPGAPSLEELELRQQITESVVLASLDVDDVLAEIDYEHAQILEISNILSTARDRRTNLLNLANIVTGTGSAIIGTAMQFSDRTAIAGDAVGVAGGTGGVVLSILGLRVQGGKQTLGIAPNMLAPLFDRRPELRSVYPQDVWTFLNTAPVSDPRIRVPWREQLVEEWVHEGRIGPPSEAKSQKKIDLLTSRIGEHKRLPIGVLTDRSLMLLDLRGRVALMKRSLRELMKAVSPIQAVRAKD